VQHHVAVSGSPDERAAAIAWLRSYNRDDVRATYAIREWLRKSFDALPGIEDWVAPSPR
jgi:predicted RecB family nuclease